MVESKQIIAKLFIAFGETLNSMDDNQFEQFLAGKAKLRLVTTEKRVKDPADEPGMAEAIAEFAKRIHGADSRAEAESLIASIKHPRRKDFLIRLSNSCGVSVRPKDTIAMIEHRLVEGVVGDKLRSNAIKSVAF